MRKGLAYLGDLAGGVLLGAVAVYGFGLPQVLLALIPLALISARGGRAIHRNWGGVIRPAIEAVYAASRARAIRWREAIRRSSTIAGSFLHWMAHAARQLRPAVPFVLEGGVLGVAAYLTSRFYPDFWILRSEAGSRAGIAVLIWLAGGLAIATLVRRRCLRRDPRGGWIEPVRLLLIGGTGLWLMRGFARFTLHGTPDALWYATMLGDITAQSRAGVFPFWTGQSLLQFNGSIFPLRVAPAFHYAGALLDFLTLRTLGTFALQNLLVTLMGIAGIYSAYFCLSALLPGRRWTAAALAFLFLSCPGVLGIAYNTDLFMSWMSLPWVPVVWFSTVRSFADGGSPRSLALLGGALGLCWWAHSPIALWSTLLAGAAQVVRITVWRTPVARPWIGFLVGAGIFGAIAAYPIGSVLLFPPDPGAHSSFFTSASAGSIAYFLRQVFPAAFLPLSPLGRKLGDFQLGWALWFLLIFLLAGFGQFRRSAAAVPVAAAGMLALLTLPVPGINLGLWTLIPGFIRNTTGNWAMNRLYLAMAGPLVIGAATALASEFPVTPRSRRIFQVGLAVGCAWSLAEASKFANGSRAQFEPPATAVDMLRPENILATRFAYMMFPSQPEFFTEGVADPFLENRLYRRDDFAPLLDGKEGARAAATEDAAADFVADYAIGPGVLVLGQKLTLEPSRHYLLQFDLLDPRSTHGVLQIRGPTFFREYVLPDFGGERSFGAGNRHSNLLSVWTSALKPEELTLHFYPDPAPADSDLPFGHVRLLRYAPAALPLAVTSWIPYRIDVSSPAAAWLETPRMYQLGYRASIAGAPALVRKSPNGLVAIAVPAGSSQVELVFQAPAGLKALFWFSLAAIACAALAGLAAIAVRAAGPPAGSPP